MSRCSVRCRGRSSASRTSIDVFLQYARPATPRFEVRDLNDILNATARFLHADFRQSGVELVLDLEPLLPSVELDEGQLRQALLNILGNARQVMQPGGRCGWPPAPGMGGEIVVEIADTGPGIPADSIEKIFEPFFSKRAGGTGLGLAIARQMVENHGGRIEVDSQARRGNHVSHPPSAPPRNGAETPRREERRRDEPRRRRPHVLAPKRFASRSRITGGSTTSTTRLRSRTRSTTRSSGSSGPSKRSTRSSSRPESSSQRVGGEPSGAFVNVRHRTPLLSLDNARSDRRPARLGRTADARARAIRGPVRRRAENRRALDRACGIGTDAWSAP